MHSYIREDFLHFGHCPYLGADVQFGKPSEYLYTDILCDWISKGSQDKEILCCGTLNNSHDTDICVLVDIEQITGQITEQIAGYSG